MRSTIFSAIYFSCLPLLALTASAQTCSPLGDVKITFFGWPDNSPPGAGIAWTKCGHSVAGGTGSYDDPITFATATDGDFAVCDIVYLPYVKKYARYEDDCEQCKTDWDSSHQYHIDLWTGSSTETGGSAQTDCENSMTGGSQTIVRNPSSTLPTDTTPFFSDGNCNKKTFTVGPESSLCSGSGSGGGDGPSSSKTSTTTTHKSSTTSVPSTLMTATRPAPSDTQCTWQGHCHGNSCNDYNDCDGQLICIKGKCASIPS